PAIYTLSLHDALPIFDRRLRGGAGRLARQGCAGLVGVDHRTAEGGLDRGARALAEARPLDPGLRLRLGGRYPSASPARGREAVQDRKSTRLNSSHVKI